MTNTSVKPRRFMRLADHLPGWVLVTASRARPLRLRFGATASNCDPGQDGVQIAAPLHAEGVDGKPSSTPLPDRVAECLFALSDAKNGVDLDEGRCRGTYLFRSRVDPFRDLRTNVVGFSKAAAKVSRSRVIAQRFDSPPLTDALLPRTTSAQSGRDPRCEAWRGALPGSQRRYGSMFVSPAVTR